MEDEIGEFDNMEEINSQQDVDNMEEVDTKQEEGIQLEDGIQVEEGDQPQEAVNPFGKKPRTKKSPVLKEFLIEGKVARCVHCKNTVKLQSTGTTSHLKAHLGRCLQRKLLAKKQQIINFLPAQSEVEGPALSSVEYDHGKQREAIAQWILAQNKAFRVVGDPSFTNMFKVNLPFYEKISRTTAKDDCMKVYKMEKEKLKKLLKTVDKVSLTTDLWKSDSQKQSYMCVTGHFVDRNWKLQKRVLTFASLPPPHGGYDIAQALRRCAADWGIEDKVFSISVDNASNNDLAMRLLTQHFWSSRGLPLDGKLFHVRCCAHILNLIVKDGISEIKPIISLVIKTITHINASESRMMHFSGILLQLNLPDNKLVMEVKHRWNSTYEMLVSAAKVKDAFPILAQTDDEYKCCPCAADWEKLEKVMKFLEVFYEATQVISATDFPTSNMFLVVIWRVKEVLKEKATDGDADLAEMVEKMRSKFDKYWGQCNLLMSIASILDPRYKMLLVNFTFNIIYDGEEVRTNTEEVQDALKSLYDQYKAKEGSTGQMGSTEIASTSSSSALLSKKDFISSGVSRFNDFVNSTNKGNAGKSELDAYLAESIYQVEDDSDFDVLQWWKASATKYPTLSKMARDILAIPITTVASESTFSTSGRVLDSYRSSLLPDTVQALVCGGD